MWVELRRGCDARKVLEDRNMRDLGPQALSFRGESRAGEGEYTLPKVFDQPVILKASQFQVLSWKRFAMGAGQHI
jgi:hypothetical protein